MALSCRLTLATISRLRPGETAWDTDVKGFGARCRATGTTYMFKKRINGRQVAAWARERRTA